MTNRCSSCLAIDSFGHAYSPHSAMVDEPPVVCHECGADDGCMEEVIECDDCGDYFAEDELREGLCKSCRTFCTACQGTGIGPYTAGRGGDSGNYCGNCHGTGQITEEEE